MEEKIFFTDEELKFITFVLRFYKQSLQSAKGIFIRRIGKKTYETDLMKTNELLRKIQ